MVTIKAYPPDKRKRDLDNLIKPLFDSMTEYGVFDDDSQIDEFSIKRCSIQKGGRIDVSIQSA